MKHIHFLPVVFLCFFTLTIHAQISDHGTSQLGKENLLYVFRHEEIQGSPFMSEKWSRSVITTNSGSVFRDLNLKFDSYNNKFVYNVNDTPYLLTPAAETVYIYPDSRDTSEKLIFKKGYAISSKINPDKYVQVLAEGKISLFKYYNKSLEEYNEYNNAAKLMRFKNVEQYYILQNGQYNAVILGGKKLQPILGDHWQAVETYMKSNNLTGKNEKEWMSVINYYNSL